MKKIKYIFKEAGVLLIAAILVLTSLFIVPMTAAQKVGHDVGVTWIISPISGPMQSYQVEVTIENFGTNQERNFYVNMEILKKGQAEYFDQVSIVNWLQPGETRTITFPIWTPADPEYIGEYKATACTLMGGDENTSNDCLTKTFYITMDFMGVGVAPLGLAEFEIVGGKLDVTNCVSGQPETDGVWTNLEDSYNHWDCVMENPFIGLNKSLQITTFVEPFEARAMGEPVPGAEIFIEQEPGEKPVMNLGWPQESSSLKVTVSAFVGQNLVFNKENIPTEDGGLNIGYTNANEQCEYLGFHVSNKLSIVITLNPSAKWTWAEQAVNNLSVDRIEVIPENLNQTFTEYYSYSSMYVENISEFNITEMYAAFNIFGFNHKPLGNALLNNLDGKLVVSNIGTSGDDGVQVYLPDDEVCFRPEIEIPTVQDMCLELSSKGIVDGVPNSLVTVTSFDITDEGRNIQMSFNPSSIQPEYLWVNYYVDGSPMPIKTEKIMIWNSTNPTWEINHATGIENFKITLGQIPQQIIAFHTDINMLATSGPYSQSLSNLEDNGIVAYLDFNGEDVNVTTPEENETKIDAMWIITQNTYFELENYTDLSLNAMAINPASISLSIADEKAIFNKTNFEPLEITGPSHGRIWKKYDYTVRGIDPLGGDIYYWIYWGDDGSAGWLGPYSSGVPATANYWWILGNYTMGALFKNIDGFYSSWGVIHLTIPRTYNPLILRLLERFPHMFPILRYLMGLN